MEARVGVLGLGVGYALACCLAEAGYDTVGIDIDPRVVGNPRVDASTQRLLEYDRNHRKNVGKRLKLSTDYNMLKDREYLIVCVSTGDEKKLILGNVEHAVDSCSRVLSYGSTIMAYSTLPFGSSKRIRQSIENNGFECDKDIRYVHIPLMIAQGTTADDFVNPPFVAFGSYSKQSGESALQFYKQFVTASSLWRRKLPPMFVTTPETAELAKLTANAFLSTKMSFANMTDMLCKKVGVDSAELLRIVGSDWRIGSKMLKPGFAWGGNCFPRDAQSLVDTYAENGVDALVLRAALEVNEARLDEPSRILRENGIRDGRVLVLGLAYKSGTSFTSGSKSLQLLNLLREMGYDAVGFDPHVAPEKERDAREGTYDAIIVTTDEPCFDEIVNETRERNERILVLDYRMPSE